MTFPARLNTAATAGCLSTADLALWFGLPYSTIRSWRQGTEPSLPHRPQIEQRLRWLESAIKSDPKLPVPLSVRKGERKQYVQAILTKHLGANRGGRRNR